MADEIKRAARKRQKKTKISDIERQISLILDTGKVEYGYNQGIKELLLGNAQAVIYAKNISDDRKESIRRYAEMGGIKAVEFEGTSLALGKLCGKLFPVSLLVVKDLGEAEL